MDKAALAGALESVLGPIDTEEAAARAVEAVYQALGWRPDSDHQGAVEAIEEHVDTVMPRDGSTVDMSTVASSCEQLWKAVHPERGRSSAASPRKDQS